MFDLTHLMREFSAELDGLTIKGRLEFGEQRLKEAQTFEAIYPVADAATSKRGNLYVWILFDLVSEHDAELSERLTLLGVNAYWKAVDLAETIEHCNILAALIDNRRWMMRDLDVLVARKFLEPLYRKLAELEAAKAEA